MVKPTSVARILGPQLIMAAKVCGPNSLCKVRHSLWKDDNCRVYTGPWANLLGNYNHLLRRALSTVGGPLRIPAESKGWGTNSLKITSAS